MSLEDGGYSESQLITIGGYVFVCRIDGAWVDGHYIEKKNFTPEMVSALAIHHADNIKCRVENIGE